MNNSITTNLIIQVKWDNSLKDTVYQNSHKEINRSASNNYIESTMSNLPKEKASSPESLNG